MTGAAKGTRSPFATLGLDHVVVRVADMDRALAFYSGVMGWPVERRVESIGLVQMRAGGSMVDLVPRKADEPDGPGNMDHFAVRIAPWDPYAIRGHLKANGYDTEPPAKRVGAEGNGWSIYVNDPDGNTVELKGPAFKD